mmetsp:Transcript_15242/g.13686  ORF Transcript_15242/g.13686 Transcript_15242/m.13686 type:complete len:253 (-) Transcript_15242:283-1041(-)
MAAPLKQPQTQKPLTNVAVVRYKYKNKRFEIACYKNKVLSWRRGVEKDISEVLQTETIFKNVQRGIEAPAKDLKQAFKTTNETEICKIILEKGQLQVSKKERKDGLEAKFKEIATIICDKCVDKETKKPFPVSTIENAMKELHFNIKMNKSSKVQAVELISVLKENNMPIERAQMKLKIDIPKQIGKKIKPDIQGLVINIEKEIFGMKYQMTVYIDPGNYRTICDLVNKTTKGQGNVQVLDMAVQNLEDEQL